MDRRIDAVNGLVLMIDAVSLDCCCPSKDCGINYLIELSMLAMAERAF